MSIIYEALQKAQKQRESTNIRAPKVQRTMPKVSPVRAMAFTITILLLTVMGLGITFVSKKLHTKPAPKVVAVAPKPKPIIRIVKLKLNGVFLSNDQKVAMINQQMYRLGERVEGMKIVSIELDTVLLRNDKQMLELRV